MKRTKLTEDEIATELRTLPGWERKGQEISRTFDRQTFKDAISFVDTLAEFAERADHHPDMDIRYSKVKVTLSTHSEGGLTGLDIALARQIQAAAM